MAQSDHKKCCCKNGMCDQFRSDFANIPWSNSFCRVSTKEDRRKFCLRKVGWDANDINNVSKTKDLRLSLLHFHPHDIIANDKGGYALAKTCVELAGSNLSREFGLNMPSDRDENLIPVPTCTKQNIKEFMSLDTATRIMAESSGNSSAQ